MQHTVALYESLCLLPVGYSLSVTSLSHFSMLLILLLFHWFQLILYKIKMNLQKSDNSSAPQRTQLHQIIDKLLCVVLHLMRH